MLLDNFITLFVIGESRSLFTCWFDLRIMFETLFMNGESHSIFMKDFIFSNLYPMHFP